MKHGGDRKRVDAVVFESESSESCIDLLALDDALTQLKRSDPRRARLVELRFFAGLRTGAEINVRIVAFRSAKGRTFAERKATLISAPILSNEQAALVLGISTSTADNDWAYAKTWFRIRMGAE